MNIYYLASQSFQGEGGGGGVGRVGHLFKEEKLTEEIWLAQNLKFETLLNYSIPQRMSIYSYKTKYILYLYMNQRRKRL